MALSPYLKASALSEVDAVPMLPPTEQLLMEGGDARIALDAKTALNKYGCGAVPDPTLNSFGSSTASVISEASFFAANQLRDRLFLTAGVEPREASYARELQRIRRELTRLCEVSDVPGLELVFAASGTDLHFIAAQFVGSDASLPTLAVMVDAAETGSGVFDALAGPHVAGANKMEIATVAIRLNDGTPRHAPEVDAEIESLVTQAVTKGQRVLLVLVDHSKTGIIAPSPACAAALHRRFIGQVEVLVDACQFRMAPSTLRAYLAHDFMVALTGSKFVTGPSFSGALFIPRAAAQRFRRHPLPPALRSYASQLDCFHGGAATKYLDGPPNWGMLLRWEAALEELRAFRATPEDAVANFLQLFARSVRSRLMKDASFEALAAPRLDRRPLVATSGWDHIQTIFPFILKRPDAPAGKTYLTRDETMQVYRLLPLDLADYFGLDRDSVNGDIAATRFQLGQPVACGHRDGVAVSALRLCASTRLVVEATAQGGRNASAVIARALAALDKAALLAESEWIGADAGH